MSNYGTAAASQTPQPVVDNSLNLLQRLSEITAALETNTRVIADAVCGCTPSPIDNPNRVEASPTINSQLRKIVEVLNRALSEADRARNGLGA